jgi:aldose 1-epimerase
MRQTSDLIKGVARILLCCLLAGNSMRCRHAAGMRELVDPKAFERSIGGRTTHLYILKNGHGLQAAVTDYGACLAGLLVPDKDGLLTEVVPGFDSLGGYIQNCEPYTGMVMGCYGHPPEKEGVRERIWEGRLSGDSSLVLRYMPKEGQPDYPSSLTITYTLTADNALKIVYHATTEDPAVVDISHPILFNLNGVGKGRIDRHRLLINADRFIPVDTFLMPAGDLQTVRGGPFDFRRPTEIGARIGDTQNIQLQTAKGYEHTYLLHQESPGAWTKAAVVTGDRSGIKMTVYTTEAGLVFYSGNRMAGKNRLRTGQDDFRSAFCLEAKHLPDAVNMPAVASITPATASITLAAASITLEPGAIYHSTTSYQFSQDSR